MFELSELPRLFALFGLFELFAFPVLSVLYGLSELSEFYGLSGLFEYMPLAASRFRTSSASAPPTKPVSADAVPATGRYEKTAGVWRNTDASAI